MPEQSSKNVIVTSDEVDDILSKIPIRFGIILTGFISLLILLLVLFGYLVKYPDVVAGEFSLNSSIAPIKFVSNSSGNLITTGYKPKSQVRKGTYIGYIRNAARFEDIIIVDSLLNNFEVDISGSSYQRDYFPKHVNLGELNERYYSFLRDYYTRIDQFGLSIYREQEQILKKQITSQESIIRSTARDIELSKKSFELVRNAYNRDSVLFSKRVLSTADFESTRVQFINAQRNYENLIEKTQAEQYQLEDIRNKMKQISIQKSDAQFAVDIKATGSFYQLREGLKQWQIKYAFISPIDGILEFSGFWNTDDFISSGQEIFTIIPSEKNIYGQLYLPETGAGKVRIGQKVNIKLNDFPYNEYGSLTGQIEDISLTSNKQHASAPSESLYLVKVSLKKGLQTNYGIKLNFRNGAKGRAEIVTDDRRLYERLFDSFKYQLNRQ